MGKKKKYWDGVEVPKGDDGVNNLDLFNDVDALSAYIADLKESGQLKEKTDTSAVYTTADEEAPGSRLSKPLGDIIRGTSYAKPYPQTREPERMGVPPERPNPRRKVEVDPDKEPDPGFKFRLYSRPVQGVGDPGVAICDRRGNSVGIFPRETCYQLSEAQLKAFMYDAYILAKLHMSPDVVIMADRFLEIVDTYGAFDADDVLVFMNLDGTVSIYIADYEFATGEFYSKVKNKYCPNMSSMIAGVLESPLMATTSPYDYNDAGDEIVESFVPYRKLYMRNGSEDAFIEYMKATATADAHDDGMPVELEEFLDDFDTVVESCLRDIIALANAATDTSDKEVPEAEISPYADTFVEESEGAPKDNRPFRGGSTGDVGVGKQPAVSTGDRAEDSGTRDREQHVPTDDVPVGDRFLKTHTTASDRGADQSSGSGETLGGVLQRAGFKTSDEKTEERSEDSGGDRGPSGEVEERTETSPEEKEEKVEEQRDGQPSTEEPKSVPEEKEETSEGNNFRMKIINA